MVGRHPGYVTTQGEILADALGRHGYTVHTASGATNRYRRLVEIAATVVRRRRATDVLLVQTFSGPSFVVEDVASRLGRLCGVRIVFHLHGGAMPQFMRRFPRWTRRVLGRGDALVVPSAFLAEAVAEHGFAARVIPNIVDLAPYPYRHRTHLQPRLFWMRAFHPLYHPELALHVLARVRAVHPDATLVMAGQEKGLGEAVRAEARRLKLSEAVRFAGFLDHAGKVREGDAADVFLNTNRVDNAPVSVIEAAAMGLPIVATDVGGLRHLVRDGDTALLVPEGDADAMAAAVLRLLAEPALAARLSANGRALADASVWAAVAPHWDDLLGALLPGHTPVVEPFSDEALSAEPFSAEPPLAQA